MTGGELIVRRARVEDIPGLVASSARLFAEDGGTRDPSMNVDWPLEHGAASFDAALADPARLVLAAECDGEVVGHLMGSVTGPSDKRLVTSATLISLYVRSEYRRARAGARLVGEFLEWAGREGAEFVEVTAYAANADAIRFYERNGFGAMTITLRQSL
ncbi:GNAT family N-acetyltransferase [Streptomyces sp. NPDC092369]|uniref:GNAT family N-acetyltransferase n=1 Tax=Streptomyces sp. NPDC092369 TaxID=3366015 RepID=UPI0038153CA1